MPRPLELAGEESKTITELMNIASEIPEAETFVVLQPTSPLREEGLIDSCITMYEQTDCSNLATGYWCHYREFGTHNNLRRQDYKGFFYDNGSVYVLPRYLVQKGQWFGNKIGRIETSRIQNY